MFTSVVMDGAEETLAWKMSLKSSTRNLYHHFTIYCGRLLSSIFNITWFEGESSSFTTSPAQWGWGGGGDHGKMQIIKHENMTVDLITWWMMILPRDASVERQTWRSQPRTLRCLATHPSQDWELGKLWFKSSNMEHGKVFWNTIKNVVYIDSYFAYIHDNIIVSAHCCWCLPVSVRSCECQCEVLGANTAPFGQLRGEAHLQLSSSCHQLQSAIWFVQVNTDVKLAVPEGGSSLSSTRQYSCVILHLGRGQWTSGHMWLGKGRPSHSCCHLVTLYCVTRWSCGEMTLWQDDYIAIWWWRCDNITAWPDAVYQKSSSLDLWQHMCSWPQ